MNKTLKTVSILLVMVFISMTPISASKLPVHTSTHIKGIHDKVAVQGDEFTMHAQVVWKGVAGRERGITNINYGKFYFEILDSKNYVIYHYAPSIPRVGGNDIKVDTSKLKPGTYTMNMYFDGENGGGRCRVFNGCQESATLTILPLPR